MINKAAILTGAFALALAAATAQAGPGGGNGAGAAGGGNGAAAAGGGHGHGAATSEAARSGDTHGVGKALGVLATTPASTQATTSVQAVFDRLFGTADDGGDDADD